MSIANAKTILESVKTQLDGMASAITGTIINDLTMAEQQMTNSTVPVIEVPTVEIAGLKQEAQFLAANHPDLADVVSFCNAILQLP